MLRIGSSKGALYANLCRFALLLLLGRRCPPQHLLPSIHADTICTTGTIVTLGAPYSCSSLGCSPQVQHAGHAPEGWDARVGAVKLPQVLLEPHAHLVHVWGAQAGRQAAVYRLLVLLKRQQVEDEDNICCGHLHTADRFDASLAQPNMGLASQKVWIRQWSASGMANFPVCWCSWSASRSKMKTTSAVATCTQLTELR